MSVSPIIESAVGMYPLGQMKKVSAEAKAKAKTSASTQKKIAVGIGVAATVAAAVIFRKDISKLIGKLPAPIKEVGKKVVDFATNTWNTIKGKLKPSATSSAGASAGVSNWISTAWNGVMTAGKTVGKWAVAAWNVTKDFCVSAFKKFMGLFAKPTVPPTP